MRQLVLVAVLIFFVAGCGQGPAEKPGAKILEDRTAWKKLTKGMTPDKVKGVLGEPLRVENQGDVTGWYYQESPHLSKDENGWVVARGMLLFSTRGGGDPKLTAWREP